MRAETTRRGEYIQVTTFCGKKACGSPSTSYSNKLFDDYLLAFPFFRKSLCNGQLKCTCAGCLSGRAADASRSTPSGGCCAREDGYACGRVRRGRLVAGVGTRLRGSGFMEYIFPILISEAVCPQYHCQYLVKRWVFIRRELVTNSPRIRRE